MSEGEAKHGVQGLGQVGYRLSVGIRGPGRGQCSGHNSPVITDICLGLSRPGILLCPCHKPVREVVPLYPFSVGRTTGEMPAPDEVSREESWDRDDVVIRTSPTATTPRPAHRRSESKDTQERGSQQRGLPLTGGRFHI